MWFASLTFEMRRAGSLRATLANPTASVVCGFSTSGVEEAYCANRSLNSALRSLGSIPRGPQSAWQSGMQVETGVSVEYRCDTIEKLVEAGEVFDVVLAMEVIEHVANIEVFLDRCAELVRPGGLVILSTINRTVKSWAFAIAMGEYVLRLLPRGSHQWRKFVRPDEIRCALETKLFRVVDVRGVTMNLRSRLLQLSNDSSVNYMLTAGLPRG